MSPDTWWRGSRITIQPAPGASEDEIRLFLQGAVWSALLLQRGLLPLHGSAVKVRDRAVVITGHSGNGKSTLVAALLERGYALVADELCALVIQAGHSPLMLPGFPQVLLWADSLRKLGKDVRSLTPVRPGLEKYTLPCQRSTFPDHLLLDRVYILALTNTPAFDITPLTGAQKIHALLDWTYRVPHVAGLGLSVPHFKQCADAAPFITVKRIERPQIPFDIDGLVSRLEEDLQ